MCAILAPAAAAAAAHRFGDISVHAQMSIVSAHRRPCNNYIHSFVTRCLISKQTDGRRDVHQYTYYNIRYQTAAHLNKSCTF